MALMRAHRFSSGKISRCITGTLSGTFAPDHLKFRSSWLNLRLWPLCPQLSSVMLSLNSISENFGVIPCLFMSFVATSTATLMLAFPEVVPSWRKARICIKKMFGEKFRRVNLKL